MSRGNGFRRIGWGPKMIEAAKAALAKGKNNIPKTYATEKAFYEQTGMRASYGTIKKYAKG